MVGKKNKNASQACFMLDIIEFEPLQVVSNLV